MLKEIILLLYLSVGLVLTNCDPIPKSSLISVTFLYEQYIMLENGTYKGFLVYLLDKIAQKSGINYQLKNTFDGKYKIVDELDNISGLMVHRLNKSVNFVVVEITIHDQQSSLVDLTEPFRENPLAALIQRKNAKYLCILEDLLNVFVSLFTIVLAISHFYTA